MSDAARTSSPSLPQIDRAKLEAVVCPIAKQHGAEIVDFELKQEPMGWVLRVYVEKLGSQDSNASTKDAAVDLELCTKVSRDLSPALDEADVIPQRYHLEVSSPGIERPLRLEKHYVRFAGQKAKLKLANAVNGQKVLIGVLGPVKEGHVHLVEGHKTHVIALDNVTAARLVFEFGPAPKPGKKK